MYRIIGMAVFAFVCGSTTSMAGAFCPINPTPPNLLQGQQKLLDPTTGKAWSGPTDDFPYGNIAIGGRMSSPVSCDRLTVEYEIREVGDPLSGAATATSAPCRGACDHSTSFNLAASKAYAWQWRTKVESFCYDGNGHCDPDPKFSSYTAWQSGPDFRHWGGWTPTPGADHTINELAIVHGRPLGEESEDKRALQPDGVYMNFGAVPLSGTKRFVVEFLVPVDFVNEHQIEGVFRSITLSDVDCDEEISADRYSEKQTVKVTATKLKAGKSSDKEVALPDISGWLAPKIGEFSGARTVGFHFRCTGDRPFTYGADFISIRSRELTAR